MKEDELRRILERYLDGTATPEEIYMAEAFFERYETEAKAEAYANISGNHETVRGEILDGLYKRYRLTHRQPKTLSLLWRAAAVILVLIIPAYLLYEKDPGEPVAVTAAMDIAPGSDKAILILSDDTRIELDSGGQAAIPDHHSAAITNTQGRLKYVEKQKSAELNYHTIVTPRGGQYQLILADGSKVWLNASSTLRYPTTFVGNDRSVVLTGEAYFEIAEDKSKPFHVRMLDADVQVLGTRFNINAYPDENAIKTTLLEGSLRVNAQHGNRILEPDQQAQIGRDGSLVVLDDFDVHAAVAWKDGLFVFDRTSIDEVMRQIARWYDVDVFFEGDVPPVTFGGLISRRENVSSVIRLLELAGALEFEIMEGKIVVKAAGKEPVNLP